MTKKEKILKNSIKEAVTYIRNVTKKQERLLDNDFLYSSYISMSYKNRLSKEAFTITYNSFKELLEKLQINNNNRQS